MIEYTTIELCGASNMFGKTRKTREVEKDLETAYLVIVTNKEDIRKLEEKMKKMYHTEAELRSKVIQLEAQLLERKYFDTYDFSKLNFSACIEKEKPRTVCPKCQSSLFLHSVSVLSSRCYYCSLCDIGFEVNK